MKNNIIIRIFFCAFLMTTILNKGMDNHTKYITSAVAVHYEQNGTVDYCDSNYDLSKKILFKKAVIFNIEKITLNHKNQCLVSYHDNENNKKTIIIPYSLETFASDTIIVQEDHDDYPIDDFVLRITQSTRNKLQEQLQKRQLQSSTNQQDIKEEKTKTILKEFPTTPKKIIENDSISEKKPHRSLKIVKLLTLIGIIAAILYRCDKLPNISALFNKILGRSTFA